MRGRHASLQNHLSQAEHTELLANSSQLDVQQQGGSDQFLGHGMGVATATGRRKKQLLLAIARAVDDTGRCRSVTQDDLAAACGCTVARCAGWSGDWLPRDTLPTADAGAAVAAERRICTCCRVRRGTPVRSMSALVENESKPDI